MAVIWFRADRKKASFLFSTADKEKNIMYKLRNWRGNCVQHIGSRISCLWEKSRGLICAKKTFTSLCSTWSVSVNFQVCSCLYIYKATTLLTKYHSFKLLLPITYKALWVSQCCSTVKTEVKGIVVLRRFTRLSCITYGAGVRLA